MVCRVSVNTWFTTLKPSCNLLTSFDKPIKVRGASGDDSRLVLLCCALHATCSALLCTGTNRYLRTVISNFGVEHTFVDLRDAAALRAAVKPNTRVRRACFAQRTNIRIRALISITSRFTHNQAYKITCDQWLNMAPIAFELAYQYIHCEFTEPPPAGICKYWLHSADSFIICIQFAA